MTSLTIAALVLSVVILTTEAGGHGQGQQLERGWGNQQGSQNQQGEGGAAARSGRGGWQGRGGQGQEEDQGWQGQGRGNGRSGPSGRQGSADSGKWRTNLFNDDDVYGYEANYPNGEALYVNYRNTDARARRGPDFARSNSISARSRMGQNGQEGGNLRRQYGNDQGQQPMW